MDMGSGEITQLSDTKPVRGEYWPFTLALKGAGACLAAIGSGGREVFYFEGTELIGVNIETLAQRSILKLPDDRRPQNGLCNAATHIRRLHPMVSR